MLMVLVGLDTSDFMKIFTMCPSIKNLLLENAGQFKDEVLNYLARRPDIEIKHFRVGVRTSSPIKLGVGSSI